MVLASLIDLACFVHYGEVVLSSVVGNVLALMGKFTFASHKGLWKDCPLFSGRKCISIYRKVYYGCPPYRFVHYGEIVLSLVFI